MSKRFINGRVDSMPASFGIVQLLAVMLGASLGACIRWFLSMWLNTQMGFAWGTLAANLVGAFAIGYCVSFLSQYSELAPWVRLFLITGLLGGLTTFSSFSIESVEWWLQGRIGTAIFHMSAHVIGSLVCTYLGIKCYQWM